jgi:hypothetical protein
MTYTDSKYQDYNTDSQEISGDQGETNLSGDNQPNWQNWKNNWNNQPEEPTDESSDEMSDMTEEPTDESSDEMSDMTEEPTDESSDEMSDMTEEPTDESSDEMSDMSEEPTDESSDEMSDMSHGDDSSSEDMNENGEGTTITSTSDAGIPLENPNLPPGVEDGNDIDKLDFSSQYTNPNGMDSSDQLSGTEGTNTFNFDLLLNAKPEIYQKHVDGEGKIDWEGVTGENGNYHDHWLEGIGEDTIMDFSGSGGEGDKIQIDGHTATVKVLEELDNQATLGIYSDQDADGTRGNGAHDFDVLGKITINHDGNFNFGSDVSVNAGSHEGVMEFA